MFVIANVGTNWGIQVDGTIVIFDIETSGVARKLRGHTRQIQSLRYQN